MLFRSQHYNVLASSAHDVSIIISFASFDKGLEHLSCGWRLRAPVTVTVAERAADMGSKEEMRWGEAKGSAWEREGPSPLLERAQG